MSSHESAPVTDAPPSPPPRPAPAHGSKKTLVSATVGAVVEWYEYSIYATSAALVFATLFFPSDSPAASQIAAFATFGVGFLTRPIGGWIAGYLGDRYGRKRTLLITFAVMTTATVGIGLLPTEASIGVLAPVLLCVCRLLQGLAVGGEWGGAAIIAVESAPPNRKGFFGSWPQIGVSSGFLMGTTMVLVCQQITGDQFLEWGWRIPFLASAVLAVVGLYIRLSASESQAFVKLQQELAAGVAAKPQRAPIVELFRDHWRTLILGIMVAAAQGGTYYIFVVFLQSYVTTELGVPKSWGLIAVIVGASLNIAAIPLMGILSDRIGRRTVMISGALGLIVLAWPLFALIGTGTFWGILIAVAVYLALLHAAVHGPLSAQLCELFPTQIRYTGISISFQTVAVVFSGFMPTVAAALVASFGSTVPVMMLIALYGLLTTVGCLLIPDTRSRSMTATGWDDHVRANP